MKPENLSLWDRIFNRCRKEVIGRGTDNWFRTCHGVRIENSEFTRDYVEYKITDRVTGSEEIKREYIN